mmetsp:Transcript_33743/g.84679  ORF Transcript_33743/g.84679 Transcript_33743/m.84679 type:complete len:211 (-) Transcript_33743:270-902(-)
MKDARAPSSGSVSARAFPPCCVSSLRWMPHSPALGTRCITSIPALTCRSRGPPTVGARWRTAARLLPPSMPPRCRALPLRRFCAWRWRRCTAGPATRCSRWTWPASPPARCRRRWRVLTPSACLAPSRITHEGVKALAGVLLVQLRVPHRRGLPARSPPGTSHTGKGLAAVHTILLFCCSSQLSPLQRWEHHRLGGSLGGPVAQRTHSLR